MQNILKSCKSKCICPSSKHTSASKLHSCIQITMGRWVRPANPRPQAVSGAPWPRSPESPTGLLEAGGIATNCFVKTMSKQVMPQKSQNITNIYSQVSLVIHVLNTFTWSGSCTFQKCNSRFWSRIRTTSVDSLHQKAKAMNKHLSKYSSMSEVIKTRLRSTPASSVPFSSWDWAPVWFLDCGCKVSGFTESQIIGPSYKPEDIVKIIRDLVLWVSVLE